MSTATGRGPGPAPGAVGGPPGVGGRHAAGSGAAGPSVARAGAVMAAGTGVSRVLGFVRVALLVALLGTAAEDLVANAFDVAGKLPATVYLLLAGGALNAVVVPQIARADADPVEGRAVVDRLVTLTLAGLAAVTVVLVLLAGPLVSLYVSGRWPADQRALAVAFAVWCLPQVFFYGAYAVFGQILNARGSFGPYTWAPVANNVVAIAGLGALLAVVGPIDGRDPSDVGPGLVAAVAGTATLGVAVQALVLAAPLRAVGYRFRPRFRLRGTGLRSAGVVAAWTFAALACTQVAYLVLSRVSTAAGAGATEAGVGSSSAGNAAWTQAFLLFMLPHSLLAVSLVTARFTGLSRAAAAGDTAAMARDTLTSARTLLVAMSLAGAGLAVLAQPVAVLLFGGAERGAAVGAVVAALALGLPAYSTAYLLQRVFYAFGDGRTPFLVQAVTSASWIAAMLAVSATVRPSLVVPLAAAALSASQLLSCGLLLALARRRLPGLPAGSLLSVGARALAAAAVAAGAVAALLGGVDAVGWPVLPTVGDRGAAAVVVAAGGAAGVLVFAGAAWVLRLGSPAGVVRAGRAVLRRGRRR